MEHSRRSFLARLPVLLALTAGILAAFSLLRQAVPRLSKATRLIKIGNINRFPVNRFTYLEDGKLFVYRDHEGISAVSAICTHLGCVVEKSDEGFLCPCHGSCYNDAGEVVSGAASKDLSWFMVTKAADGQLVIDLTRRVSPDYKLET
jgi:cytochrome b6-f complex iron-sulfur subunit